MSVRKFCLLLNEAKIGKNDKKWFPPWVRRYASTVELVQGRQSVTEGEVIRFLQTLRDNGTPAWQRLQAIRAVEMYRDLVWQTDQPALHHIRQTLSRIADRERATGAPFSRVRGDDRDLVGIIDPSEPAILQQMRRELRLRRKAMETEKAYVGWARRFIGHCGSADLQQFGEPQIRTFLTSLAVDGQVAAGTQDQAKSALLFLYQSVLGRELAFLDVTAANKPARLPVVLSRGEITLLLPEFSRLKRLMFLAITRTASLAGSGCFPRSRCREIRGRESCGVTTWARISSAFASRRQSAALGSRKTPCPILCVIRSRRTCWRTDRTFGRCKSCWDTRTLPQQ